MDILLRRMQRGSASKSASPQSKPEADLRSDISKLQGQIEMAKKDPQPSLQKIFNLETQLLTAFGALSKQQNEPGGSQGLDEDVVVFAANDTQQTNKSQDNDTQNSSSSSSSSGNQLNILA